MKTEDLETTTTETPSEMDTLMKEIESATDEVVKAGKTEKPAEEVVADEPVKDLPEGKALPDEKVAKVTEGKKDDEIAQSVTITDSHIERAVKAGMSIADAKAFTSIEAFDRVCGMLEAKKPDSENNSAAGEKEETVDAEALLAAFPALDPEAYDENIIAGFDTMKKLIMHQSAMITELRQSGSRQEVDWLDSQIQGLGEDYADVVGSGAKGTLQAGSPEAAKRAEIERKFKVLEAGYKAAGEETSRESVFKEAVSLTLGESVAKVKTAKKEEALKSREKLLINRADGARVTPKKDALDETADEIDRKFFGKK